MTKPMSYFLFTSLLGLGGAAVCLACPAEVVVSRPAVVKKAVVVEEVVPVIAPVAVFQPVAVAIPAYGAGYVPTAPAPPPVTAAPAATREDEMLKVLKGMDERLRRLEGGAVMPKADAAKPDAALPPKTPAVFAAKCAACHGASAQADGGGFAMLAPDGGVAKLTDKQLRAMVKKIRTQAMPPKDNKKQVPPLTEAEAQDALEWLDEQ